MTVNTLSLAARLVWLRFTRETANHVQLVRMKMEMGVLCVP